jgi:hypothetical protein
MFMNNVPNSSDFIGSVETPKNTSAVTDTVLDATENPSRTDNQPAVTNDVPDTNTPVVVVTETPVTNQPVATEAPVTNAPNTNTPVATEAPVVAAPIVINSRMAGTRTDVTREEWERAFALSFSLPETLSNTMVVQYTLIRDGDRLLGGNISISDGLDEAVKWMSATVRPVSPETNPFAVAGADVILDGTVIPRSEMSVIGQTETLIASSVCEFFGQRSYGVFNSRSFQVTFESVEFTTNMVSDFVRAFG